MALTMSNATYARSKDGIIKLMNEFDKDIKTAQKQIKGEALETLLNTIKKNWVGVDADYYLKQINTKVNEIIKQMNTYSDQVNNALNSELTNFSKFQNSNKI